MNIIEQSIFGELIAEADQKFGVKNFISRITERLSHNDAAIFLKNGDPQTNCHYSKDFVHYVKGTDEVLCLLDEEAKTYLTATWKHTGAITYPHISMNGNDIKLNFDRTISKLLEKAYQQVLQNIANKSSNYSVESHGMTNSASA